MPKKACHNSNGSFAKFDSFGQGFRWNLPGGRETLGTSFGATISILMSCILIFYGILQMHRLIEFGETIVMTSVKDSYYTYQDEFPNDIEELQFKKF